MRDGRVLRLDAGLVIRVVDVERRHAPSLESRIDAVWRRLNEERPGELYDGSVATLERVSPGELQVGRAPFRHFAAQSADAGIRAELDLWCLGVAGVTTVADRLLFGRRAGVTHYPGHWELVPSGHLPVEGDPGTLVDGLGQLLEELHEEVGVSRDRVQSTTPLALVPDVSIQVSDVFFALELDHSPVELEAVIVSAPRDEYDAIEAIDRNAVGDFVRQRGERMLGSTVRVLRELGHTI